MLLLHILLFDRAYVVTRWVNYAELRGCLRRRHAHPIADVSPSHGFNPAASTLAARLHTTEGSVGLVRGLFSRSQRPGFGGVQGGAAEVRLGVASSGVDALAGGSLLQLAQRVVAQPAQAAAAVVGRVSPASVPDQTLTDLASITSGPTTLATPVMATLADWRELKLEREV